MIVLGLTGSIGMGKSATAAMFREAGVPVHDADAEVARLYGPGGAAVEAIGQAFPGCTGPEGVDREALRKAVIGDAEALARLEAIVHPLTARATAAFLAGQREAGARLVVLDVPLLFETGGDRACDLTLLVSAPAEVQRARVLARPGMTPERLDAILARQLPDAKKRARADFIVSTAHGFAFTRACVAAIIALLRDESPTPGA
jgi:dephospho-CoA kinase